MSRRFSERVGLIEPRKVIQKGYIDDRLWARIWSAMARCFWNHFSYYCDREGDSFTRTVVCEIQDEFLGRPIDEVPGRSSDFVARLKLAFPPVKWAQFYDLVQFLGDLSRNKNPGEPYSQIRTHAEVFIGLCNEVLEKEKSAYRFVGGELVEITSEQEISEIEEALGRADRFDASREHIRTALKHYGSREKPDYRNSIKESISAIESSFIAINGEKSKSLGSAIGKAARNGFVLPPALKSGILNLYGWTSDEGGVRHALIEEKAAVGEAEAKLMIVLCSALVNYISTRSG